MTIGSTKRSAVSAPMSKILTYMGHACILGFAAAGVSFLSQYELLLGTTYGAIGGAIVGTLVAWPFYYFAGRVKAS